MNRLHELFAREGQSPWLDNLKRSWIASGELERWVERGARGITSNPSIFQKAMTGTDAYDDQLRALGGSGASVEDSYWELVIRDILDALEVLLRARASGVPRALSRRSTSLSVRLMKNEATDDTPERSPGQASRPEK